MRISCLHTNAGNISYYEAAAPEGVVLTHFLRPELYLRAGTRDTAEGLAAEVAAQLRKMSEGADAVLTAATVLAPHTAPPAVSADALLVEAIARRGAGRRVEVFHSNPLAADIVTSLYSAIGGTAGVTITALPEAWDALRCGDHNTHASLLRKAIDRSRADLVALAHPAMADVADHDARILSLVHTALRFFVETGARARGRRQPGYALPHGGRNGAAWLGLPPACHRQRLARWTRFPALDPPMPHLGRKSARRPPWRLA